MEIKVTDTFLDGVNRYEKGEKRVVSDEDGQRFIDNQWATAVTAVELDIANSVMGQEANHG